MLGINLHSIVRGPITSVHPDEAVVLYSSAGSQNVKGKMVPVYAEPVNLMAQIQSESDDKLFHADKAGQNDVIRRMYLFADKQTPPSGIVRPKLKGEDVILRVSDSTWWKVVGVIDDFSSVEWVAVRVSLQMEAPQGVNMP